MSFHDDEILGKAYDSRLMRRLLGYLAPYKARAAVALLAIVAGVAFQLAQPVLVRRAIDQYMTTGDLPGVGGSVPPRRVVAGAGQDDEIRAAVGGLVDGGAQGRQVVVEIGADRELGRRHADERRHAYYLPADPARARLAASLAGSGVAGNIDQRRARRVQRGPCRRSP